MRNGDLTKMRVRDQTIRNHKLLLDNSQPQTFSVKRSRAQANQSRFASLCSSVFADSRYSDLGRTQPSTELQSINSQGIWVRCPGSLPGWGCSVSSDARCCRPEGQAGKLTGGVSQVAEPIPELNVICTIARASRTKPLAGKKPGWQPTQRAR